MHDLRLDVERRQIGQHVVEHRASPAAAGLSTTCSKFLRSALKWPAITRPTLNAAARTGLVNVEKHSAIAVTTASSTRDEEDGDAEGRVDAGASHAAPDFGRLRGAVDGEDHDQRHRHHATFTLSVDNRPRNLPSTNSARLIGLASSA